MIELLIVVGILGILAAGLLAAIDPLEQLKKGRDTTKRNIAVEYNNALTRYFAVQGQFPWSSASFGPSNLNAISASVTQTLTAAGELKSSFNQGLPGGAGTGLSVYSPSNESVLVCFHPESKSIRGDPSTLYNSSGATLAGCPDSDGTPACYWCAR